MAEEILATIVVTPRERFSRALRSLATVIENTSLPHRLVYVSGGDPPPILEQLQRTCAERGYEFIAAGKYLGSNEARNIGLARVQTKYAVFLENDMVVEPGWLEALVTCAEETGAAIVGPLILYGEVAEGRCHSVGGDFYYKEEDGSLTIEENHRLPNVDLKVKRVPLSRSRCDYVEFHCLLARRDFMERVGPLDCEVNCVAENVDLCLLARQQGLEVYSEPASVVSMVGEGGHLLYDTDFFDVRWSLEWFNGAIARLESKWQMPPDASFLRDYRSHHGRYRENCRLLRPVTPLTAPITPTQHPFTRTLAGLAGQMAAHYTPAETTAVKDAYPTAELLFAGVVGERDTSRLTLSLATASVLAAFGAPVALIIAGLHAGAYTLGRFPEDIGDDYAAARRWLHRRLGGHAEELLHEYTDLSFEAAHAAAIERDIEEMRLTQAYTVLLRVAVSIAERLHPDPAAALMHESEGWGAIYEVVTRRLRCPGMLDLLLSLAEQGTARAGAAPVQSTASLPNSWRKSEPQLPSPPLPRDGRPYLERLRRPAGPLITAYDLRSLKRERDAFLSTQPRFLRRRSASTAELRTATQPWAYACFLDLDPGQRLAGPAQLKVEVMVRQGRIGLCLLTPGSTTEFSAPEVSVEPSSEPIEVLFHMADIRETGRLVFRNWQEGGSEARILSVSLHKPS